MPNAILDPTGTAATSAAKAAAPRAPRPASLNGKRVGLLINTKLNARPFLEEVGRLLTEQYGVTVTERTKQNFAVPETEAVIKEMADVALASRAAGISKSPVEKAAVMIPFRTRVSFHPRRISRSEIHPPRGALRPHTR